ncbi:MAG: Fe-Mn family superoxide dismutase [Patescibacteria group bacterium]
MKIFEEQKFNIPELKGISQKSVEDHLKLYAGYVKNYNALFAEMQKLSGAENPLAHSELTRRMSFEFDGMRLHEIYFSQFEGSPTSLTTSGTFESNVNEQFGSIDRLKGIIKNIGMMRGPGWALLYWDPKTSQFLLGFSEEQHVGHFVTLPVLLALDVWEHAYLLDQGAAGKGAYIDAFFENVNWKVVEANFAAAQR